MELVFLSAFLVIALYQQFLIRKLSNYQTDLETFLEIRSETEEKRFDVMLEEIKKVKLMVKYSDQDY